MRFIVLSSLLASVGMAAEVNWGADPVSHTDLTQAADSSIVSTTGTLVAAFNVGGPAATVNGVSFTAGSGTINLPRPF